MEINIEKKELFSIYMKNLYGKTLITFESISSIERG